ncbi:carboxypeptidase regulatory-like domain-containing protein [Bacteroidota bacterium]
MIKKLTFLAIGVMFMLTNSYAQSSYGTLVGKVTDAKTGEPLIGCNVVVTLEGVQKGGASTNIDGDFVIKPIPPGKYNIQATYIGYRDVVIQGFQVFSGKISKQDIKLSIQEFEQEEFEYIESTIPLVDVEESSSKRLGKDEIKKAPTRSVGELVELTAGVQGGSVKGQRAEGTVYFIDGVRVRGFSGVPQGMIAEINTITGGVSAEYGDFTGGVVSITTRGPSNMFSGGIEMVSSQFIDPYGYNTFEGNISGPLIVKKNEKKGTISQEAILGYLISGTLNFRKDPYPSPGGIWQVRDSVYDSLLQNPLSPAPNGVGFVPSAEFITMDQMEKVKTHDDIEYFSYQLSTKFDFQPSKNINLTLGGMAAHVKNKGYSYYHSLFNYREASQAVSLSNTFRGYFRFLQKLNFGSDDNKAGKGVKISNAYYTLMIDYTKQFNTSEHALHKQNYFDYGYLGSYERYSQPVYRYDYDTVNGQLEQAFLFSGYQDTLVVFTPDERNLSRANYTSQLFDLRDGNVSNLNTIQQFGGLLNGDGPGNVYSLWANVGSPYSTSYGKYDEDQIRVTGKASLDINHHAFSFGFEYEQRLQNYYVVGANSLWTVMRSLINSHLTQLDTRNPIPVYDETGTIFLDTIKYNIFDDGEQTTFDKSFRDYLISQGATDVYGNPITQQSLINIDRYSPDMFSLDMFSPDELLSRGLVSYYGYDYLGNKLKKKPSIDDFLDNDDRLIAPLNPIYMAGFIQDQFFFRDMIFRIGLRIDRFDANQPVLKDKYSLYPTRSVAEVSDINGKDVSHPGNIGNDYVVYVDDPFNPTEIVGYRNGDNWYDARGAEVTDPNILALETTTGSISPYLVEDNEEDLELSKESFKDYVPQIDLSPRIYFSFPISDEANFYANYDIRVQRPTNGIFTTIDDYYFLEQRGTSSLNNASLEPQRITSYELGFKQAISTRAAIALNAYYSETRDLINVRMINQAYPRTYMTFDNIDFSTVKGVSITYDMRRTRTKNVQMYASYTLQFADGTGSNAASQAGLISAGQPNLRTPFPLDNDFRHGLSGSLDYRFKGGSNYNGPIWEKKTKEGTKMIKVLENTGVNFLASARSGRPYSKQGNVTETQGVGIRQSASLKGTMNGSRYPWAFNISMKIDRDFFFYHKKTDQSATMTSLPFMALNVYIWVQNIFDIRNIAYLYRYTGDPDDDGFLSSSYGITAVDQATLSQAFYDQYYLKVNSPFNYGSPRFIRVGGSLSF